jgi:DNA-binding IclR family transcriptional regulator
MAPETVPDDLRRFILTSIPSVPCLEALMLLKKGDRDWSLVELAQRLYLPEKLAAQAVDILCAAGMAITNENRTYRFGPATPELGALIDRLAAMYARDLISVTTLIHSRLDKSAQVFADAFKWQKDK